MRAAADVHGVMCGANRLVWCAEGVLCSWTPTGDMSRKEDKAPSKSQPLAPSSSSSRDGPELLTHGGRLLAGKHHAGARGGEGVREGTLGEQLTQRPRALGAGLHRVRELRGRRDWVRCTELALRMY
jgi:hypothetical protein